MFKSIYDDILYQVKFGNNVSRLIIINVAVFILLYIVFAFVTIFAGPDYTSIHNTIVETLSIPSRPIDILKQPWTIVTHMFLHQGLFHLVFNMILLYFFGQIWGDLMNDRRVVPLYLLAGFSGALFFVLGVNFVIPSLAYAHGASAAVLGIVIAAVILNPDKIFRLMFLGEVKVKFIALVIIVLDLVGIATVDNTGGHFAHIGGMVMGWFFLTLIQNDNDPTTWFHNVYQWFIDLFSKKNNKHKPKSPLKVRHKAKVGRRKERPTQGPSGPGPSISQTRLDAILDKISEKGMASLTPEEKEFLNKASKDE